MMLLRRYLLLVLLALGVSPLAAAPIAFNNHNFSLEIPPAWKTVEPLPPQTVLAVQNPDNQKTALAYAITFPAQERAMAGRQFADAARKSMTDRGYHIEGEGELVINGVPFHRYTVRISKSATMTAYTAAAGNEVYLLQMLSKSGEAATDPELQLIVNSFRLLTPAEFPGQAAPSSSASTLTPVHLAIIAAIGITTVFFIRRARLKNQNQRGSQ